VTDGMGLVGVLSLSCSDCDGRFTDPSRAQPGEFDAGLGHG